MASAWRREPPGFIELQRKLLDIQIRMTRLELIKKLQRAQLMLQALARRPHGR